MKKLYAGMVLIGLAYLALAVLASNSMANAGIAHGIGPHVKNIGTISVGPVYDSPGRGDTPSVSDAWRTTDEALSAGLADTRHAPESARKARCDQLHAEYVSRHRLTTPRPLKTYSGCQKWAMDAAYWRHRRNESPNVPSFNPFGAELGIALHGALSEVAVW